MPTNKVNLNADEYVKVNNSLNPLVLQAHRDSVRIVLSEERPVKNNSVFHMLGADKDPLVFQSIDTNVWALAMTDESSLIATETDSVKVIPTGEYLTDVSKGLVEGHSVIHKFGHGEVGTTVTPITSSGLFNAPISAKSLEIISDNVNDTDGGSGASKITVHGLDADWNEVTQEVSMGGINAVVLPTNLIRLSRWYVSESGSYANESTVSYAGNLVIREVGGGTIWDTIDAASVYTAQSEIGIYTIPKGYTGYLLSKNVFTDTAKIASIFMLQRNNADDVVAPFAGVRRILERDLGVSGGYNIKYTAPKGPFIGPCDIGFMGNVTVGTAAISVEFELLIIKDGF